MTKKQQCDGFYHIRQFNSPVDSTKSSRGWQNWALWTPALWIWARSRAFSGRPTLELRGAGPSRAPRQFEHCFSLFDLCNTAWPPQQSWAFVWEQLLFIILLRAIQVKTHFKLPTECYHRTKEVHLPSVLRIYKHCNSAVDDDLKQLKQMDFDPSTTLQIAGPNALIQ